MPWLVGYVQNNAHEQFKDELLKDQGIEVWYPVGKVVTKPKRKKKPVQVEKPLFGNYVFIQQPHCCSVVLRHRYLISLIRMGPDLVIASDEVVDHMKTVPWSKESKETALYSPGETVVMSPGAGSLEGFVGIVVQCTSTDVWVMVRGWVFRLGLYLVRKLNHSDSRTRLSDPVAPTRRAAAQPQRTVKADSHGGRDAPIRRKA